MMSLHNVALVTICTFTRHTVLKTANAKTSADEGVSRVSDEQNAAQRPKPTSGKRPPTPMWVKISGLIGIGVAVAFVILHLTGIGMVGH
jgi:hypothetical protein